MSTGLDMDTRDEQLALNIVCRRLAMLRTFMIIGLGIVMAIVDLGFGIALPLERAGDQCRPAT